MATQDLPDIYAHTLRLGHIYPANPSWSWYYYYLVITRYYIYIYVTRVWKNDPKCTLKFRDEQYQVIKTYGQPICAYVVSTLVEVLEV